jgi:hypothetical protein
MTMAIHLWVRPLAEQIVNAAIAPQTFHATQKITAILPTNRA